MRAADILSKKRDGYALAPEEIAAFVAGATSGDWPQYQVAALLMAIYLRGMNDAETTVLTNAMIASGTRIDLSDVPGPKVDKHSTGGVGDKTSLVLAPLAAACGVIVPMMSGRGLGHTGGTLDKLESIPGFRVRLSLDEFRAVLRRVGCAMVGQTADIVPADRLLYALRDVTATVESIPLIAASIMSKKIAAGVEGLVLDVKVGSGAFMKTAADARRLARAMVAIGQANGVRTEALLTAMDYPLGRKVGNSLEVVEAVETLQGRGPADLEQLSCELAARMVHLAGVAASLEEARVRVDDALTSGRGLDVFRRLVECQGGDPRAIDDLTRLPMAPHRETVESPRAGYIQGIDAEFVGRAACLLGAGRDRADEDVDPGVGVELLVGRGADVSRSQPLAHLYYRDTARLHPATVLIRQACRIDDRPPQELILEAIG